VGGVARGSEGVSVGGLGVWDWGVRGVWMVGLLLGGFD